MSKVKNENFITVQGWMVNELKLKGNELLIYSLIYGFSQDGEQSFTGSLQYMCDWTNSTKAGVLKVLKRLLEKGVIEKQENIINGVKFCEYRATKFTGVCNKVEQGMQQSLPGYATKFNGGMQQSLPNNILDNKEEKDIKNKDICITVVDYLNQKTNTKYRATNKQTVSLINARVNEGYSVEDFEKVIDTKVDEWKGTEMATYLRPSTLFGNKFEGYLNQMPKEKKPEHKKWCTAEDTGDPYAAWR